MGQGLTKVQKYYRYQSRIYDVTRWVFLLNRKKAIDQLGVQAGDSVVDFGCGTGLNFPYLLRKNAHVIGIDFSDSMLDKAKVKFPGKVFIKGDILTYRFKAKSDKALCTYGLSLIKDWKSALIGMKEALNPEGTLVVLDFYEFKGPWKIFNFPFKWWLSIHDVVLHQKVGEFLKGHFASVEEVVPSSGYCCIIKAKGPL